MKLSWQKKSCPKSLTLVGYACSLQTTGCSEVIVNEVAVFEVFRCLRGTRTAEHYSRGIHDATNMVVDNFIPASNKSVVSPHLAQGCVAACGRGRL